MIKRLFNLIAIFKVLFLRSGSYIGVINFILLIGTFKQTYNMEFSFYYVVPLAFLLILIIGYLDYKLILFSETRIANTKNDIKIQLNRMEELIKNG